MGYFDNKEFEVVSKILEKGIQEAMKESRTGIISNWTFGKNFNVLLLEELDCGCKEILSSIDLNIKDKPFLEEESFLMQMEEILLELDDKMGNDNMLFYIDIMEMLNSNCAVCDKEEDSE